MDATSQWLNVALLNGDANESISGRAHREQWKTTEKIINTAFSAWEFEHCRKSYLADVDRAYALIEGHNK